MRDLILALILAAVAISVIILAPVMAATLWFLGIFAVVVFMAWGIIKLIREDLDDHDPDDPNL